MTYATGLVSTATITFHFSNRMNVQMARSPFSTFYSDT